MEGSMEGAEFLEGIMKAREPRYDFDVIDSILKKVYETECSGYLTNIATIYSNITIPEYHSFTSVQYEIHLIDRLQLLRYINPNSPRVMLTTLGMTVYEAGGWVAYLSEKKRKEEKEEKLREQEVIATVCAAESSKVSAESAEKANTISEKSYKTALGSLFVSILGILWTLYLHHDSKSDKDKLEQRIDSLENDRVKRSLELNKINKIQMKNTKLKTAPTKAK